MDYSAAEKGKLEQRQKEAKARWGETAMYEESVKKSRTRSAEREQSIAAGLMSIFQAFGVITAADPSDDEAQQLVENLQQYITDHYYHCSSDMLSRLGDLYADDDAFRDSIDQAGGPGTASFVKRAIDIYCTEA